MPPFLTYRPLYLGRDDDGGELLVFGPVAFKTSMPNQERSPTRELLDERTQQLDDLRLDVRALLDVLNPPPLPPMILENERAEAGGAGRKCADCGHVFEQGDKSFECDRCETCAKVELAIRVEARADQARQRQRNAADLAAGGVRGFPFGRRH